MGTSKQRWRISFHKSPSKHPDIPIEFICSISGSLMADPVVVSSGHTFERHCVHACKSLSFTPLLPDGSVPDFSTIIPNLALKATILNFCRSSFLDPPKPINFLTAENLVFTLMATQKAKNRFAQPETELHRAQSQISVSSEESVTPRSGPTCYSSSSASDVDNLNTSSIEEDELVGKLKSSNVSEQEEALISFRKLTRTREETRFGLCTPRVLSALRVLITSRYASVQVNSVAALVNLSLENRNKVKIVRSGIVPCLIDVLKSGFQDSQEHVAGALFSLALDDQNKTAIGVLGALPPLLHALRSDSERTRHDSTLALYHLSLVQSNRAKLVKLGAVQALLGMVKTGHMMGRILLILCNLAVSSEGRAAMLDGGAVECFVCMLRKGEFDSESTRENCLAALYGLSHGGLRFKGLAKEAAAEELLIQVEEMGSQRAKEKARKILEVLRQKDEEEEEVDWEKLLNSDDDTSQTRLSSS
ncbi:U-box domain-containing protein 40 [Capsicum annuum]|uniref:RING-type E3 ubiquitin transferase n=1 Tax=Capsicum annuum TaxID=4072 RepID=A0A2G3AC39_CAPAN|nr:U-box domain-containing protein 40 [Capsicum annuum]PHT91781.1 U-box domain-containing protein 40 [Capsicum annuum]